MRAALKRRAHQKRVENGYFVDGIGSIMPRLRALGFKSYRGYLGSNHWARVKESYGIREACEICGATERLQIHHRTYAHLGEETAEDLVALCDRCHYRVHQSERMGGRDGLLGALKRVIARVRKADYV